MKWLLHLLLSSYSYLPLDAQPSDYPNAHLPATWANNRSVLPEVKFNDGKSMVRPILLRGTTGVAFSCGFFSEGLPDNFLFAILIVQINSSLGIDPHSLDMPKVVWHAETKTPITEDATLQLTVDGDLVLRDVVGNAVWSTNTSEKNITVMSLTEMGNLVLFDERNASVWQSFDHPTDALLSGQKLVEGQRLTAAFVAGKRVTPVTKNLNSIQFNVSLGVDGLSAFIDFDDHQQMYYKGWPESEYLILGKGSMELLVDPKRELIYYMRLESDGRLVIQQLGDGRKGPTDIIIGEGTCSAPAVCGEFGICSNGHCSCPQPDTSAVYFRPINSNDVSQGCFQVTPLDCEKTQYHDFLQIQDVSYFNYMDSEAAVYKGIDENSCKKACMDNCSCQAALFQFGGNLTNGSCFLPSHLFSLENNRENMRAYNSSAFVKVQMPPIAQSPDQLDRPPVSNPTPSRKKIGWTVILGSILGASLGAFLIIIICVVLWRKRADVEDIEEDSFNHVAGILTKFSYEDLKAGTANFCRQLGAGGFGSVFEGALGDGMKVAVKRLNGIRQGRKDFLAEVETIGTIHHVNLVRLIGFCAEKSYRLLVYEYMCNGSLDKWIYPRNHNPALDWTTRKKIILDIAKGLSYLHEECRERIAHLDIKPENILLDENLNAKLSDFGLSKLIDRDLSHVTTTMRGTPGYMAPEWLSSKITAKVDVYSFGIVVLEIVCGRKNLDSSQPEESSHLVSLLKKKAEDNQLFDMVDKQSSDMQCHVEEAVEMIRISIWCLQGDHNRRPSMSMVIKVLEGVMDIEPILDYDFLTPAPILNHNQTTSRVSSPLVASTLSGPR